MKAMQYASYVSTDAVGCAMHFKSLQSMPACISTVPFWASCNNMQSKLAYAQRLTGVPAVGSPKESNPRSMSVLSLADCAALLVVLATPAPWHSAGNSITVRNCYTLSSKA